MSHIQWLQKHSYYKFRQALDGITISLGILTLFGSLTQFGFQNIPLPGEWAEIQFQLMHFPISIALLYFYNSTRNFYSFYLNNFEAEVIQLSTSIVVILSHTLTFIIAIRWIEYWMFGMCASLLIIALKNLEIRYFVNLQDHKAMKKESHDWLKRSWIHFGRAFAFTLLVFATTYSTKVVVFFFSNLQDAESVTLLIRNVLFITASFLVFKYSSKKIVTKKTNRFSKKKVAKFESNLED